MLSKQSISKNNCYSGLLDSMKKKQLMANLNLVYNVDKAKVYKSETNLAKLAILVVLTCFEVSGNDLEAFMSIIRCGMLLVSRLTLSVVFKE